MQADDSSFTSSVHSQSLSGISSVSARWQDWRQRGRGGDVRKAAAMLLDPLVTKAEVARHFCVSRVTLNASLKREGFERSAPDPGMANFGA